MNPVSESAPAAFAPAPSFQLDCASFPAPQALEMLQARFGANFELKLPAGRPANQVGGEHFGIFLDGLLLGRRRMHGLGLSRTAALVRRSQMDHYMLVFSLEQRGPAMHSFASGPAVAQRGTDLMLLDMAQPMRVQLQPGNDVSLFIPRDALDALLPRAVDLHGAQPRGVVAALLAEHLGSLLRRGACIGQAEAPALSQGILHMVAASLAPQADSLALARPRLDDLLLRRIGRYVEEHIADPDLGLTHLRAAFGLSRAHAYRLLEPAGGPAAFIRERRLAMVHRLLADSQQRRLPFKRLVDDFGFRSASQFSRAFKERFGYNAKELRANPEQCAALARPSQADAAGSLAPGAGRFFDHWLRRLGRQGAPA